MQNRSLLRPDLRLLLILCLISIARPGRAQGTPAPVVSAVEFSGLLNVPESRVREAVKLKPGGPLTPQQLEADRKAVLGIGYFRSVAATQQTEGGRARVTFRVVEWPVVVHIRILGNTVVDTDAIRVTISTRVGQVLSAPQLQDDVRAIEGLYHTAGYVARVSERLLDEATKSGILRFEILEVEIDDVEVEGGTDRQQRHAREALREVPPELYQPDEVTRDEQRLLKLKGVDRVAVRVEPAGPGKVRIRWLLNPPEGTPDQKRMPSAG